MGVPASMFRETLLLPSILSADFSRLGEEIEMVMEAGVRMIHVDVMDGHFVPNITIGPAVVERIAPLLHRRGGALSVHLMVERPEAFLGAFVEAGADALSVHVEACRGLYHALETIKAAGVAAGVALNPGSSLAPVREVAPLVDYALAMTVNPGFGGQKLIEAALARLPEIRALLPAGAALEVDGGINRENIARAGQLGANWIVAGAAVFGAKEPAAEVRALQDLMRHSARL